MIQSDLKDLTDVQAKESLLTMIREQKKYIEQLEESKDQAFKEMSELSSNKGFDYSAWVSVLLASIGVLVIVVGVMIALISFVGYKNFKESTKEAAETISRTTASTVAREEVKVKINEVPQHVFSLFERHIGVGQDVFHALWGEKDPSQFWQESMTVQKTNCTVS